MCPSTALGLLKCRLVRKHLSFPDRAMASAIRAAEGDFRNWAEIRAWAAGIASALQS
jgi:menaquinone-dependent protoporphyrinogen oxidase